MADDLNLAQTLGGLRIANPDRLDSSSPLSDISERPRSRSRQVSSPSTSTAVAQDYRRSHLAPHLSRHASDRASSPADYRSKLTPNASPRLSVAERTHAQRPQAERPQGERSSPKNGNSYDHHRMNQSESQQYSPRPPSMALPYSNPGARSPPASSSRPISMFPQTSSSAVSSSSVNTSFGRLRSESSRSSLSGPPKRSNSRASASPLQAGVPTRDSSHQERSYRQSQPIMASNGPFPPRKSSNARLDASVTAPPTMDHSVTGPGSPYVVEGGPPASSEEWKDRGAARGIQRELDRDGRPVSKYVKKGVKDFNFGRTLGEGSYSTVIAATDRQTLKEYAVKVLDKRHIIKEKKVKYVNIEKDTLNRLTEHPGIVRLYYTFQDERSLYFVLDVASGGELLGVLKRMTTFDEECTRFYAAQILDAVDYMHSKGVIHRDLKPENVLLDDAMHVKITDFGTAKILETPKPRSDEGPNGSHDMGAYTGDPLDDSQDHRANSFVGTAEYVSPELLTNKSACKASDLWAFGCIVYQLLAGRPPFKAGNEYQTFQKIVGLEYEFPPGFPPVAKDLVERLLVLDPAKRLSIEHIKHHEFFKGIVWGRGLWKQKAPRLKSYGGSMNNSQAAPPNTIIKLDGIGGGHGPSSQQALPPPTNRSQHSLHRPSVVHGQSSNGNLRPSPRVITELPPPSQVDIEWSPVLTSTNERILKLGNLMVQTGPAASSPNSKSGGGANGDGSSAAVETPTPPPSKRFSRFFGGGGATKKRQRLVMITSSARIVVVSASGDEKKTKTEVSLLVPGCSWRQGKDSKGGPIICIDTKDKQLIFEEPTPNNSKSSNDTNNNNTSNNEPWTQSWIETMERSIELARSQQYLTNGGAGSVDSYLPLASRSYSSLIGPDGTGLGNLADLDYDELGGLPGGGGGNDPTINGGGGNQTMNGLDGTVDGMGGGPVVSTTGKSSSKRMFSKRQSKNGLTAVF
ncbi:MAG: hypothetical protein M1823_005403 [Watsoniomyces obsoletus]|nr:MAG: hypothetical protein M1823_005403 [Watsoniomyces obsoletus]